MICECGAKVGGWYQASCLECCARLVLTARPSKRHAGCLIGALLRFPGNPGREAILQRVAHLVKGKSDGLL